MYDVIILGGGPAGVSAGIFAARREMKTLMITKNIGGQMVWAAEIENYPGFKHIERFDLIVKMREQILSCGVELKEEEVQKIEKNGDIFEIYTSKNKYESKTLIIAMGLSPKKLAVPGEDRLNGKGVSYCANCDWPLFRNKAVAVVGGGNSALDAAEVLSKIANKVYLINHSDSFKGFEVLVKEVQNRENIEVIFNSELKEINGENSVQNIKIENKEKGVREILVDGIFIEIGRIASTNITSGIVERDEKNQIIINEKCETKTPGVFAAGDVTNGEFKQITIASGQGTIAALAAYQYLQLDKKNPLVWTK
jgi:thioredoxin-disulfide reductase